MEELEEELHRRSIQVPLLSLLSFASIETIHRTIVWWDAQQSAGPGVLVDAIRRGGIPEHSPRRSMLDEQREYGERICDWLNERFPDLRQESGRPHPAAIAAVIRLHYRDGKGSLTKRRHDRKIRQAVAAWREKWDQPDPAAVASSIGNDEPDRRVTRAEPF